jgi:hypothetical protein
MTDCNCQRRQRIETDREAKEPQDNCQRIQRIFGQWALMMNSYNITAREDEELE